MLGCVFKFLFFWTLFTKIRRHQPSAGRDIIFFRTFRFLRPCSWWFPSAGIWRCIKGRNPIATFRDSAVSSSYGLIEPRTHQVFASKSRIRLLIGAASDPRNAGCSSVFFLPNFSRNLPVNVNINLLKCRVFDFQDLYAADVLVVLKRDTETDSKSIYYYFVFSTQLQQEAWIRRRYMS
jgi:hypothetical protein